jgi:hypothetical protein
MNRLTRIPPSASLCRKYFFSKTVVNLWNKLPSDVLACDTIGKFKARLDKLICQGFIKVKRLSSPLSPGIHYLVFYNLILIDYSAAGKGVMSGWYRDTHACTRIFTRTHIGLPSTF